MERRNTRFKATINQSENDDGSTFKDGASGFVTASPQADTSKPADNFIADLITTN